MHQVSMQQIPLLIVGDEFTLTTDEQDLDENHEERITPAGSVWTVIELQPHCDPVMQYSVVCKATGGWIHLTHEELIVSGYTPVQGTSDRILAEKMDTVRKCPAYLVETNANLNDPAFRPERAVHAGQAPEKKLIEMPEIEAFLRTTRADQGGGATFENWLRSTASDDAEIGNPEAIEYLRLGGDLRNKDLGPGGVWVVPKRSIIEVIKYANSSKNEGNAFLVCITTNGQKFLRGAVRFSEEEIEKMSVLDLDLWEARPNGKGPTGHRLSVPITSIATIEIEW